MLLILNMKAMQSREGNDCVDSAGYEYELKTANVLKVRGFATHHHLNPKILAKYRAVRGWYFSFYEGIELVAIYRMTPKQLEPLFADFEESLNARDAGGQPTRHLNNPKIPFSFVKSNGQIAYAAPPDAERDALARLALERRKAGEKAKRSRRSG
jgi:hypothetical protein